MYFRTSRKINKLTLLKSFVLLFFVFTFASINTLQAQEKRKTENVVIKSQWTSVYQPLPIDISELQLNFLDVSADSEWVLGLQETKEGESEGITVGLVTWEQKQVGPALISFPKEIINLPVKLNKKNDRLNLSGLKEFRKSKGSIIIHLKVSSEKAVSIFNKGTLLGTGSKMQSFILKNGDFTASAQNSITELLAALTAKHMIEEQLYDALGFVKRIKPQLFKLLLKS